MKADRLLRELFQEYSSSGAHFVMRMAKTTRTMEKPFHSVASMRRFLRGPAVLVGAVLVVTSALLVGAWPAGAQVARAPDVEQQTPAEQVQAANVGDAVELVLFNRKERPTGVILEQNAASVQLLRDGEDEVEIFRRRFIYAVTLQEEDVLTQAQAEEATERPGAFAREAPPEEAPSEEAPSSEPSSEAPSGEEPPGEPPAEFRRAKIEGPFPDASRARLLFTPTARTQKPGQLYVASHELMFPYAAVGIGNVLDLRAGISVMPNTVQFMYGGAKVGVVQSDGFNMAVGGFGMATTNVITVEGSQDEYGGVAYALSTIGAPDAALTVGAGYLATGGSVRERALALVGGEYRLGDSNFKLITENYVAIGSGGDEKSKELFGGELFGGGTSVVTSAGVRIISQRTAADLGVATSSEWWDAMLPVVPVITVSYNIATF
jgi:hypothetical protein